MLSSGIYVITCRANGKVYVGQTRKFRIRKARHRYELKKGTHGNPYLQRAWNAHGPDAFTFEILERVDPATGLMDERETFWIRLLKANDRDHGFNIIESGWGSMTEEGRARLSEMKSLEWIAWRPDGEDTLVDNLARFCDEMGLDQGGLRCVAAGKSNNHRGWHCRRPGTTREEWHELWLNRARRRPYYMVNRIGGPESRVKNLARFCRKQGLTYSTMKRVSRGQYAHCKGWECRRADVSREEWEHRRAGFRKPQVICVPGRWIIRGRSGKEVFVTNLTRWCLAHHLAPSGLMQVAYGKLDQFKGLRCRRADMTFQEWEDLRETFRKPRKPKKSQKSWVVWDPDGQEYPTDSINTFARERGLVGDKLKRVGNGHAIEHRGWGCRRPELSIEDWWRLYRTNHPAPPNRLRELGQKPGWWFKFGLDRVDA